MSGLKGDVQTAAGDDFVPKARRKWPWPLKWLVGLSVLALAAATLWFAGFKLVRVPSGAMLNTLQINDIVLLNKAAYWIGRPAAGEIVVFEPPNEALINPTLSPRPLFISRCIGVPGDLIEIKKGVLYRNGKSVDEPYVAWLDLYGGLLSSNEAEFWLRDFKLVRYDGAIWPLTIDGEFVNQDERTAAKFRVQDEAIMEKLAELPPAPIPKGFYLTMGDNRLNSFDGRSWGLVPRDSILGRSEGVAIAGARRN